MEYDKESVTLILALGNSLTSVCYGHSFFWRVTICYDFSCVLKGTNGKKLISSGCGSKDNVRNIS